MKRDLSKQIVSLIIGGLLALNLATFLMANNASDAAPAPQKLEYKVWRGPKSVKPVQAKLTQFGKNGWNLVGIVGAEQTNPMFLFSRNARGK